MESINNSDDGVDANEPQLVLERRLNQLYTGGPVLLSKNEEFLVCCSGNDVNLIKFDEGTLLQTIPGDGSLITSLTLSPDDSSLAIALQSLSIRLLDLRPLLNSFKSSQSSKMAVSAVSAVVEDGNHARMAHLKHSWKSAALVSSMAFDPTSTLLATGMTNGTIRIFDLEDSYITHNFMPGTFPCPRAPVTQLRFHPNADKWLRLWSACSTDPRIFVWDLEQRNLVQVIENHTAAVTSIAFMNENELKTQTGQSKDGAEQSGTAIAFVGASPRIVTAARDGVITISRLSSSGDSVKIIREVPIFESIEALCLIPTPDKEHLFVATGGHHGRIKVLKILSTQQKKRDIELSDALQTIFEEPTTSTRERFILYMFFCPKHQQLLSITSDHNFHFWRFSCSPESISHERVSLISERKISGWHDEILDARFIHGSEEDTEKVALATNSETIRIVNFRDSSSDFLEGHSDIVLSLSVHVLDHMTLLASGSSDSSVRIWDIARRKCIALGEGHAKGITSLTWLKSSDSLILVSASGDRTIKMWDLSDVFDPSSDSALENQAPLNLKVLHTVLAHEKGINSIDASPDGKLIASGSMDKNGRIFSVSIISKKHQKVQQVSSTRMFDLQGHRRALWCVRFSPIEKTLATSSSDNTIRLWNIKNGACLKTFECDSPMISMAFITMGTQLATTSNTGLLKLFHIPSQECIRTVETSPQHDDMSAASAAVRVGDNHNKEEEEEEMEEEGPIGSRNRVWGLDVKTMGRDQLILTGDSTSTVSVFRFLNGEQYHPHSSSEEGVHPRVQTASDLVADQKLANAIRDREYLTAIQICIDNNRKTSLFEVLDGMFRHDGTASLEDVMRKMAIDQVRHAYLYALEWNTNSRLSGVAQRVVATIHRNFTPETLIGETAGEINEGTLKDAISLSERHFRRMNRLLQKSYLLDFHLHSMHMLQPSPQMFKQSNASDEKPAHEDDETNTNTNTNTNHEERRTTKKRKLEK